MAENPLRVQAKVNELNLQEPRPQGQLGLLAPVANTPVPNNWAAVPGYFALTGFTPNTALASGGLFHPSYGYVVKIFVNNRTGEMKTYPYQLFET